ncbi:conserved hypothetical protein, partial [Perkinsus marinus ATCC 50983]
MPPKKAPPKKDGAADEKDYDLENFMLQKRLEVIQHRIQLKEEVIAECQEKMEEQRKRKGIVCQRIAAAAMLLNVGFSADLESQSKRELERREEVLAEMTRQFNEMQNSFTDRIVDLKEQVKRAQEDIVEVENMKETTRREKDDEIARK